MKLHSIPGIALGLLMLADVQAQVEPPVSDTARAAPTMPLEAEPEVFILTAEPATAEARDNNAWVASGNAHAQQMRERLQDPEQRTVLRFEQRAYLLSANEGVGRALGIDATTEHALIELLLNQRMEQLDAFHLRGWNPVPGKDEMYAEAERQTRQIEALRRLLGERGLELYQAFEKALPERTQVRQFDAHLDPANRLTQAQAEQMMQLFKASNARLLNEQRATMGSSPPFGVPLQDWSSREQLERQSKLLNIEVAEQHWRQTAEQHRHLIEEAAAVLSPTQLAILKQMQAERASELQRHIERLRVQAGLDATIPASSVTMYPTPARAKHAGDVKVSIRLSIDGKQPAVFSQVVRNGQLATFDVGGGIFVDATPTLYEDGMFELRLAYQEQTSLGRRPLGEMQSAGDLKYQQATDLAFSGGSTSILVGRKAYVVETNSRIERI